MSVVSIARSLRLKNVVTGARLIRRLDLFEAKCGITLRSGTRVVIVYICAKCPKLPEIFVQAIK